MAKRYHTPAPATADEIKFAKECFIVKSNVLYWREDRPDHHFTRGYSKACWAKKSAGRAAGRVDGNHLRIATRMNGKALNRSAAWFIEAITGKPPKPSEKFSFGGLMAIMNNNLNCELSGVTG